MKKKILFLFRHEFESLWKDGLWKALTILSRDYTVEIYNMLNSTPPFNRYDFALGWGAFGSPVDQLLRDVKCKKGLCIAGITPPHQFYRNYDVLFYETEWFGEFIKDHPNKVHAFGVNTDIYKLLKRKKFWDYVTVGAFALWKRQDLIADKPGLRLAIGEIQRGNPMESLKIISRLLGSGVMVSDMVEPKKLAKIYNMAKTVYIPADVNGGGERAVLEARACGVNVEIEKDNPKLAELLVSPIWDQNYYANKLKEGIESCL